MRAPVAAERAQDGKNVCGRIRREILKRRHFRRFIFNPVASRSLSHFRLAAETQPSFEFYVSIIDASVVGISNSR